MTQHLEEVTGGCYCGRVRYRARDVSPEATECHCSQCRRQSGHRYASTGARTSALEIEGADGLTWFRASPAAERGFCATCGCHLFWRRTDQDYTGLLAASLDEPSRLRLTKHIFVDSKGDYYEIDDGLPQFEGYDSPVPAA
jgi:hypothetical protein